jgi:hypothetical protein
MCIHQEKTVSPLPKEIAHAIAVYAEKFVDQLRRNIPVTINFDDLNCQSRAFVELIAEQTLAAQKRVGKNVPNCCWFCGSEGIVPHCGCDFPESFQCARFNICEECSRAHKKIGRHLRDVFKFPRINRVSSRRSRGYRMLSQAAMALDEAIIDDEEQVEKAIPTLWFHLCDVDAYDDEKEEFRRGALGAFRAVKFTRFQELAGELDKKEQAAMLRSAVRLLNSFK